MLSAEDEALIAASRARHDELIRIGKALPEGRVLYVNQYSGSIRCLHCAGVTLGAAIEADPAGRTVHGLNGEPFTRLNPAEAAELRRELSAYIAADRPLCDCVTL